MFIRNVASTILVLGVFALAIVAARAQDGAVAREIWSACIDDYHRHCFGVVPGGGRILACLHEHQNELAPLCAGAVSLGRICANDYRQFCGNVTPGEGRLRACLEGHANEVSPGCAKAVFALAHR